MTRRATSRVWRSPEEYVERPGVWTDPLGLAAEAAGPAKRGPKTDPNAPHNQKIREKADELEANGWEIVGGGGRQKEIVVSTKGGHKGSSRPDIPARKDGKEIGINVGRTKADGSAVMLEMQALEDLNKKVGMPTTFVSYDR